MEAFVKNAPWLGSLTQTEADLLSALDESAAGHIKVAGKTEGDNDMKGAWAELAEYAENRGIKKGIRRGRAEGRAEGKNEERQANIQQLARSLHEAGLANESCVSLMMSTFKMSSRMARKYLAEA